MSRSKRDKTIGNPKGIGVNIKKQEFKIPRPLF
jgi:hypothetical protein